MKNLVSCRSVSELVAALSLVVLFALHAAVPASAQADPLFERVADAAKLRASKPYEAPEAKLPPALEALEYDGYRDIRFRREQSLWRGQSLFEAQFFHRGFLYREPVRINVVEDGVVRRLDYDPAMFDFGKNNLDKAQLSPDLGFAGFRLHYPLNATDYKDEVAVFLGASYFRILGRDQIYGLSARGLAVDTALDKGEEFPMFREFWLVKPAASATTMTVYALLDSESVSGAYRFELRPGKDMIVDVRAAIFARVPVRRLGLAPLTSMFLHGEGRLRQFDDYRPEVHDSDGLLMQTGAGEWLWRPLENPHSLRVTELLDDNPRGFGLLQRDREFSRYLDLEAQYERRPSLWVEPGGEWGRGSVYLVQIPTREEINDNIVAFWVSQRPLVQGEAREIAYRLRATSDEVLDQRSLGRVERTHVGWAAGPGAKVKPPRERRRFVVDFEGGELGTLQAGQPVRAQLSVVGGQASDLQVQKLPTGGWRATFQMMPERTVAADMRLYLTLRDQRLTETWTYLWPADALND